jgi:hypothetical protein
MSRVYLQFPLCFLRFAATYSKHINALIAHRCTQMGERLWRDPICLKMTASTDTSSVVSEGVSETRPSLATHFATDRRLGWAESASNSHPVGEGGGGCELSGRWPNHRSIFRYGIFFTNANASKCQIKQNAAAGRSEDDLVRKNQIRLAERRGARSVARLRDIEVKPTL